MRSRSRRIAVAVGTLGLGGVVLSGPGTGCTSFIAEEALTRTDFCFIFNCTDGALGGTLDPCTGFGSNTNSVETFTVAPLFSDCPAGP